MSRQLRLQYEGAVYHIAGRGNGRQKTFLNKEDREQFLEILTETLSRYSWICHAYCLMGNHYHLLIETREANLSLGMRHLNGVYTQRFNRRHKRVGHLFQGRYKSIVVEKGDQLLELSRYVVLNPVRAGMVERPESYRWSSYKATAGYGKKPGYLFTDWILGQFGNKKKEATRRYREFVREGIGREEKPWDRVVGQVYLGSEGFIASHKVDEKLKEVPRVQKKPIKRPVKEILRAGGTAEEIEEGLKEGYKMVEMARHLGVHYSTVSMRLKKGKTDD